MTEPSSAPPAPAPRWKDRLLRLKGPIVAVASAGAVISGLVGWYTAYNTVKRAAQAPAPAVATTSPTATTGDAVYPMSIMVLPFANQTGDAAKGYVADGLTSTITADLARLREAVVMAPAQAYAFKDKALPLPQLGREAGVRYIVQGSLLSSSDKVRLLVQLADATTGGQLWSDTIDGSLDDLFRFQDTVTQRVGAAIGPAVLVSAAQAGDARKGKPRAVDAVLRAMALDLQPRSEDNYREMARLYRDALQAEPENTAAEFGLAEALISHRLIFSSKLSRDKQAAMVAEAKTLLDHAMKLEAQSPRGLRARMSLAQAEADCAGIQHYSEAALQSEPNSPAANRTRGLALRFAGQPEAGLPFFQRAVALDPKRAALAQGYMGESYVAMGQPDAALPLLQQGMDGHPNYPDFHAWAAMAHALKGDAVGVKAAMARLHTLAPDFHASDLDQPQSTCTPAGAAFWKERVGALAARVGIQP